MLFESVDFDFILNSWMEKFKENKNCYAHDKDVLFLLGGMTRTEKKRNKKDKKDEKINQDNIFEGIQYINEIYHATNSREKFKQIFQSKKFEVQIHVFLILEYEEILENLFQLYLIFANNYHLNEFKTMLKNKMINIKENLRIILNFLNLGFSYTFPSNQIVLCEKITNYRNIDKGKFSSFDSIDVLFEKLFRNSILKKSLYNYTKKHLEIHDNFENLLIANKILDNFKKTELIYNKKYDKKEFCKMNNYKSSSKNTYSSEYLDSEIDKKNRNSTKEKHEIKNNEKIIDEIICVNKNELEFCKESEIKKNEIQSKSKNISMSPQKLTIHSKSKYFKMKNSDEKKGLKKFINTRKMKSSNKPSFLRF